MDRAQFKRKLSEDSNSDEDEEEDYDENDDEYGASDDQTEQKNQLSQSSDDEKHKQQYDFYSSKVVSNPAYRGMGSSIIENSTKSEYDYVGSDDQSDQRKHFAQNSDDEMKYKTQSFYSSNAITSESNTKKIKFSKSRDSVTSVDYEYGGSASDDQAEHTNQLSQSSDEEVKYKTQSFYSPTMATNTMYSNINDTSNSNENESMMYSTGSKIMEKMGYKQNQGLGRRGQGRLQPVEASSHKGRSGLGFEIKDLDIAASEWDPNSEVIELHEPIEWLVNETDDLHDITRDLLDSWIVVGSRKEIIDDENKFCDPGTLQQVLKAKSSFDNLSEVDMKQARTRSNPFEKIDRCIFLNRAAVKMANMDSMCNYMFTSPIDEANESLIRENDLLYFADVCAGPGGFTEYVLWRKKWRAKGFGFTLKACNDFKLENFYSASPDTFDPYYGIKEDGNVYDPENITSFTNYVLKQTETGVHFMMADGGFSVEGKENIQEILSKQLYLCQFLVALSIVREKGHFVCKLFDLFTPFSVGLVYLMFKCFQEISIIKPNTSRPANSERYIVCKWKKPNTDTIQRHLFDINEAMWENPKSPIDTLELVPYSVITNDEAFYNYIYNSNNMIGVNQIIGLHKIAAFSRNLQLHELRQEEIKTQCLQIWGLPEGIPIKPVHGTFDQLCLELLSQWQGQKEFLSAPEKILLSRNQLPENFCDVHDWYFVALDTTENSDKNIRTLFISYGGRSVGMLNSTAEYWITAPIQIELSPNTLVYGEIVKELQGEGKTQSIIYSFHIIDGLVLGGEDIRNFRLKKRIELCQTFAKALNKPRKKSGGHDVNIPIRCKQLFQLKELNVFFDRLSNYKLKDGRSRLGFKLRNDIEHDRFYVPRGLLFLKETKEHLQKLYSKTHNRFYYFDRIAKKSFFPNAIPNPDCVFASFKSTFVCRRLWKWEIETQVSDTFKNENPDSELLYRTDLMNFITSKLS